MYTSFYNLTGQPFQLMPDHRFFYESRTHHKALAYLNYGLNQGEGFIVITGDIGAGKSTLVGYLIDQLDAAKFVAAKVVSTHLDADDTLRMAASAFGIAQEGLDKASVLRRFESFLINCQYGGKRVLLIIDEAQNLPARALEELRMLSNFQVSAHAPMQIFLLGQPQFRTTLASAPLEQLRQRVIATYHLGSMEAEETRAYVEHRLRLVGWRNDPQFTSDAFARIHQATAGVPRRINTLCTRLLLFGALEERHEIDGAVTDEVMRDLVQEGAPPSSTAGGYMQAANVTPAGGVITTVNFEGSPQNPALTSLGDRISVLERTVAQQDRLLRRALQMLASYIEEPPEREESGTAVRQKRK